MYGAYFTVMSQNKMWQKESRFFNSLRFLPSKPDSLNTSNKTASESPMVLATSFEKLILEFDI